MNSLDIKAPASQRHTGTYLVTSQGKVLRAPDSFVPRLFKLIFDAPYQFVELL